MPRFDITFTDRGGGSSRYLIEAKDADEAMDKAYGMCDAKYYDNVWVSQHEEGLASYICEIEVLSFWNGKRSTAKWSVYERFEANDEWEAKRMARNKFIGKYFEGSQYHDGDELLSSPVPKGQCMYLSRILDTYQS